jgi:hypothetical protein
MVVLINVCLVFQRKVTVLEDNYPGCSYAYLIAVFTSYKRNAGTTSNVAIQLVGDECSSVVSYSIFIMSGVLMLLWLMYPFTVFAIAQNFGNQVMVVKNISHVQWKILICWVSNVDSSLPISKHTEAGKLKMAETRTVPTWC